MKKTVENQEAQIKVLKEQSVKKDKDHENQLAQIKDLKEQSVKKDKEIKKLKKNLEILKSSVEEWYFKGMRGDPIDFINNKNQDAYKNFPKTDVSIALL